MQGKPRSKKTADLPFIFFKIREARCPKTRRSWQRRARLALEQRTDLTAAEKHEICCVWSKPNLHQIDSAAMSKLLKKEHRPQPHQTISARSCTRRAFDVGVKKPSHGGLAAANDDVFSPDCGTASRKSQNAVYQCQSKPIYAAVEGVFPQSQGYIFPHFRHGSVYRHPFACGNRSHRARHCGRMPRKWSNLALETQLLIFPLSTLKKLMNEHYNPNHGGFVDTKEQRRQTAPRFGSNWQDLCRIEPPDLLKFDLKNRPFCLLPTV
jgi:hypothetical protein